MRVFLSGAKRVQRCALVRLRAFACVFMRGNLDTHANVLPCIFPPVHVRVLVSECICEFFYLWRKARAMVRVGKISCVRLRFHMR